MNTREGTMFSKYYGSDTQKWVNSSLSIVGQI